MTKIIKNKKINKVKNKENKKLKALYVILISISVFLISLFFISFKQNFHIDENFTYALSNNQFQMMVDDYKEYTGKEVLLEYMAVKENNRFNIKNVFFNQRMDTHPPLYYLIVNFICSLFYAKFNILYGLIINCFCMIFIYWMIRKLYIYITNDKKFSTVMSILGMFFYGFINCIVFTRMYVLLQMFSLLFFILVIDEIIKIKNENMTEVYNSKQNNIFYKNKFCIQFTLITFLGLMTEYQYVYMAFFVSLLFGIFLIIYKKYGILIKSFISGILGIILSYLFFPFMINHIFTQDSIHSLSSDSAVNISRNFIGLANSIKVAFFGKDFGIFVFLILIIILLFVYIKNKKHTDIKKKVTILQKIKDLNESDLVLSISIIISILYFLTVCFMAKLTVQRFLYNLYPIILVIIYSLLYKLLKTKNLQYFTLLFAIVFILFSNIDLPSNLYYHARNIRDFLYENKDIKTLILYYDDGKQDKNSQIWKLPFTLYLNQDLERVSYINIYNQNFENYGNINKENELLVYIYTDSKNRFNESNIMKKLKDKINANNLDLVFTTNYVHLYKIN